MILLPPYPFSHVIFFPKALKLPSPLHNLKFFPIGFDKLPPPPPGVGNEELYTPLEENNTLTFTLASPFFTSNFVISASA